MKPRIAIPVPNSDAAYSQRCLPQYASAIERSGGVAVAVPLNSTNSEIAQIMKSCAAVLLPGSPADVDPQKYGASVRHPKTSPADPPRDNVDELLLQDAHNMRKPILGICYGLQSLNVWRQGTLVQHLDTMVTHSRPDEAPKTVVVRHSVMIEPLSRLGGIVRDALAKRMEDDFEVEVNSSHHQALQQPGDGLRVVARSPQDDVIEAIEGTNPEHWVLAVQWHPERSFDEDEPSRAIFRALVEAARQWHHQAGRSQADFESVGR